MPNFDGKGPSNGNGPKSGRQMGKCEGAKPQNGLGVGRLRRQQRNRRQTS